MANFNNYHFHYSFSGNRNHPTILFLHGFTGNSQDFSSVIPLLSKSYCCLAVDLPGHGQTKVNGDETCYNMSNTAQALIELLDDLQIDKCLLWAIQWAGDWHFT